MESCGLPVLGFSCDRSSGRWGSSMRLGADKPDAFSASRKTDVISRMARDSLFG